jgi:hypothetical protein
MLCRNLGAGVRPRHDHTNIHVDELDTRGGQWRHLEFSLENYDVS